MSSLRDFWSYVVDTFTPPSSSDGGVATESPPTDDPAEHNGLNGVSPSSELEYIEIGPADLTLAAGEQCQFNATGVYSDGSERDLTETVGWWCNNLDILDIDEQGCATAKDVAGIVEIGATDGDSNITGSAKVTVAGPAAAAAAKESPLASQIRAAIASGGINIGMYIIGDPDSSNDKEFKRQAVVWAGNHGAFGLSGSAVKKDYAMPLSADPGKLVTDLLAAMKKELGAEETIPIANVALFSHGGDTSMKIDSNGAGGGEGWASANGKVVKDFAAAVKGSLGPGAKIHLYACDTAANRDPKKDRDDPTRKDDFAESLQQMTGAEVWGHEDARHTTGNPELVEVTDTNKDGNAERYQLRDVLARKFLTYVDPSLTDEQMGYLDQKLKISSWINDSMQFKGKGFTQTDDYQVFIEEISYMGYDELFDLMIADSPPDAATFRSLFPEHDEIDKLVEGAAALHAQFHKDMEKKKAAIAAEKTKPGFPNSDSP